MPTPLTDTAFAETFIYSTLGADLPLALLVGNRIYSMLAPEGSNTWPIVVFANLGGRDTEALGPYITLTRFQYALKVIGNTASIAALDPIMDRIHTLLHGAPPMTFTGGYVNACSRLMPPQVLADPDLGVQFRQLVATYEVITSKT